jgi:hypothetical protein
VRLFILSLLGILYAAGSSVNLTFCGRRSICAWKVAALHYVLNVKFLVRTTYIQGISVE